MLLFFIWFLHWGIVLTAVEDRETASNYKATVNFATSSDMYVRAYRYVTKSGKMSFIGNVLKKSPDLEIVSITYNRAILADATFCKNALQLNEDSYQTKKLRPENI